MEVVVGNLAGSREHREWNETQILTKLKHTRGLCGFKRVCAKDKKEKTKEGNGKGIVLEAMQWWKAGNEVNVKIILCICSGQPQ